MVVELITVPDNFFTLGLIVRYFYLTAEAFERLRPSPCIVAPPAAIRARSFSIQDARRDGADRSRVPVYPRRSRSNRSPQMLDRHLENARFQALTRLAHRGAIAALVIRSAAERAIRVDRSNVRGALSRNACKLSRTIPFPQYRSRAFAAEGRKCTARVYSCGRKRCSSLL